MKKSKLSNKEVIKYYSECGINESEFSRLLWRIRALPSKAYQDWRLIETKNIISKLSLKGKVLDAACGSGYLLSFLPKGSIGVDINPQRIAAAQKRKKGVKAMVADIEDLPFPANSFDAVIAAEIFEHIPDQQPMIKDMWRVLKKGGLFIATMPSDNFLWRIRYLASSMYVTEPQCVTFTRRSAVNLFEKYKFEVVMLKKIAFGLNYLLILQKK